MKSMKVLTLCCLLITSVSSEVPKGGRRLTLPSFTSGRRATTTIKAVVPPSNQETKKDYNQTNSETLKSTQKTSSSSVNSTKTPLTMLKQLLDEIEDPDLNELNEVEGILDQRLNDTKQMMGGGSDQTNNSPPPSSSGSFASPNTNEVHNPTQEQAYRQESYSSSSSSQPFTQSSSKGNSKAEEIERAKLALSFLKSQSSSFNNNNYNFNDDDEFSSFSSTSTLLNEQGIVTGNHNNKMNGVVRELKTTRFPVFERVDPKLLMKENIQSLLRICFIVSTGRGERDRGNSLCYALHIF
jgi:hypothetical protein